MFDQLMGYLPDSAMGWVNVTALAIACSSGVAAAIAKMTKNKADDKIAAALKKAHDLLGMVGLHGHTLDQKRAMARVDVDARVAKGARDHRKQ